MKAATIVTKLKHAIIDLEGTVYISEFFLMNRETGEDLGFCMPPEEVRIKSSTSFRTFQIVERGEIKIPRGEQLQAVSWHGIIPGAGVLLYPFCQYQKYEQPDSVIEVLQRWRTEGAKLRLIITETPINLDVYIKTFDYTAKGGLGNYSYDIDVIAAKPLQVLTVAEADAQRNLDADKSKYAMRNRAANKSKAGMLMGKLNTIWGVAQLLTGKGSNWKSLAKSNGLNSPINTNPTTLILK